VSVDPFAMYGEETAPTREPRKRADPQRAALQKVRVENDKLGKFAVAMRKARHDAQLDCPEGPRVRALVEWARKLTIADAGQLLTTVLAQDWIKPAPEDARFALLQLLNEVIVAIRVKAGLPPFNDDLGPQLNPPGVEEVAFFKIKRELGIS
jgi:hypothetical protein